MTVSGYVSNTSSNAWDVDFSDVDYEQWLVMPPATPSWVTNTDTLEWLKALGK